MKITKAQEKRDLQFRNSITNRLTYLFNPFRNYNYKSYVNSKIAPHTKMLNHALAKFDDSIDAYKVYAEGKTYKELGLKPHINAWELRKMLKSEQAQFILDRTNEVIEGVSSLNSIMQAIDRSRSVMDLIEIHKLEWLEEVKTMFDGRFNKMIDKMCNSIETKDTYCRLEVEELSNSWEEFEVLIHVEETTFHARAIWVNCTEKISHYRFITTTRKR